jgi:hypothetical protein
MQRGTMQARINNPRRTVLRVESLEGKTLLSAGSVSRHIASHAVNTEVVAHAAAEFSGTLTGAYSNVHIPFAGYLLNYVTSGTLSGVGSTRLHGSIFARPRTRTGGAAGQFFMSNSGGSMKVNVFRSATPGAYTYKVARASGSDSAYRGGSGTLTISQTPTRSVPYYVSGHATMIFTPG